jgi:hypothetical protein
MRKILRITVLFLILLPAFVRAETKEIPFTLDDRDRIIRTEQNLESLRTEMKTRFDGVKSEMNTRFEAVNARFESINTRFENMDKRFDQLFNFLWAIIGIFSTMVLSVFGFAFWDRKLSLAPMKREEEKIKTVLRELSKSQPKLAEIMRQAGML